MSPIKLTHRAFAVALVTLAAYWIWQTASVSRQAAADREFYAGDVSPALAAENSEVEALAHASRARQEGNLAPLPAIPVPDPKAFDRWIQRLKQRSRAQRNGNLAMVAILLSAWAWMLVSLIQAQYRRNKWQSRDRLADPDAGGLIDELTNSRGVFVAETRDGGGDSPRVEIDGARRVVTFRNYSFVTSFARNPKRSLTEVPFSDLIVGTMLAAKGSKYFLLRTAQGRVVVANDVQPFGRLVSLLRDAAERNRADAEGFRNLLEREPRVRTPWYGWAILVSAIGSVLYALWYLEIRR